VCGGGVRWCAGWADYCEGWRNEFGSTPEQDEEWRAAVKDNVNAAGEIYGDVVSALYISSDAL
jgi:hypothetical protein